MNRCVLVVLGALLAGATLSAQEAPERGGRLTVGGYGEVALTRNFYSDNVYRYSHPADYKNDPSHGRFDIPHAVIYLGYDFGKGWTMQTEIEFEHTGTGAAVEKEYTEAGEWESEIEKGGEVELEQFWIQKSFAPQFNVRIGHLVVPVGGLNNAHEPLNFFTVYRPEGEFTILPSTWHETGVSLWGRAGANAIWNITNVSRSDRPYLYTTKAWAKAMSENSSVIAAIQADPSSPYYADGTPEGIADAVLHLLDPSTSQFENAWHNFEPEMSDEQYYNFLVWHRGLSVPRARDLNREEVQRGKTVFAEIGCASCHRPSWKTKGDNYWAPAVVDGKPLPRYENQTIWPYTDMIQHRLYMKNGIHGSWCRTTPLWGRGLSKANTGAEDRLHDDRARNVIEAIMWHGYSKTAMLTKQRKNFTIFLPPTARRW